MFHVITFSCLFCVNLGNVAHDLRTPLQAFQSELEFLRENIKSRLGEKGNSLLRSVKLMERISSFMNMTINRSIDFSKASAGIKIYPSIESIDFSDTLKMSIRCLVHSHTDVPIIIASISENISNHLFTDKQWLMENLLCLLSNAQKFTNEGEIRIRCSLMSNEATKGINEYTSGVEKDIEIGGGSELKSDELEFSMLRIEVEDTGIGTVKENRQQLFTPFAMV
jgi:signal transduction histidine kinase